MLTLTVTVGVDLVADYVVDPADLVDSVVDLVLRSVGAFLLFTISVLCVEHLGCNLWDPQLTIVFVISLLQNAWMISVCDPHLAILVSVSHLMTVYLKLQCCGSVASCPLDYHVDLSHFVDLLADLQCVSLVDLLADLHVDLITLLPLHNMVSPLLKCSMHLWTADWVMYWLLSHRRLACIFSLSIS